MIQAEDSGGPTITIIIGEDRTGITVLDMADRRVTDQTGITVRGTEDKQATIVKLDVAFVALDHILVSGV